MRDNKKKKYYFDLEIIMDENVHCISDFQISHHKIYRCADIKTLNNILKDIEQYNINTTIFIRGVYY